MKSILIFNVVVFLIISSCFGQRKPKPSKVSKKDCARCLFRNGPEYGHEYGPEYGPEYRPEYRPVYRPVYRPEYGPDYGPKCIQDCIFSLKPTPDCFICIMDFAPMCRGPCGLSNNPTEFFEHGTCHGISSPVDECLVFKNNCHDGFAPVTSSSDNQPPHHHPHLPPLRPDHQPRCSCKCEKNIGEIPV